MVYTPVITIFNAKVGKGRLDHYLYAEYLYRLSPLARECEVPCIRLCKLDPLPRHEFLVYDVFDRAQRCIVGFVDMDRLKGEKADPLVDQPLSEGANTTPPPPQSENAETTYPTQSESAEAGSLLRRLISRASSAASTPFESTASISTTSLAPTPYLANDQARLLNGSSFDRVRRAQKFVELVTVPLNPPIPIHHFIAAWKVIHEHCPYYRVLDNQCFWFALVCFRLLVGQDVWNNNKEALKNAGTAANIRFINPTDVEKTVVDEGLERLYNEECLALTRPRDMERLAAMVISGNPDLPLGQVAVTEVQSLRAQLQAADERILELQNEIQRLNAAT